eukprot:gene13017-27908_t
MSPHITKGIPREMTGMAEMLRDTASYQTYMAGKWDAGMATQKHTPHGRGYNKSLAYFFHQTDYWTYYAEPQAMHGCLLPDGMLSNGSSTPVLDLWESGQPSDDSSSDGGVEGEGPANRLKPAPACNASLAPFPLPGPATADCVYEDELFKETVLGYIKEHDAAEGQ